MKKATGDLTSTVIVALSVAILVAFFFYTIWPMLDENFKSQTACEKAICETKPDADGMVNCVLCEKVTGFNKTDLKCNDKTSIKCKYKG